MNCHPLSPQARIRLNRVFPEALRAEAERLLLEQCGSHLPDTSKQLFSEVDRQQFAAMKLSGGTVQGLQAAIDLGNGDFRNLLIAAGFANGVQSYMLWMPDEAG